jgi:hypothetical protein
MGRKKKETKVEAKDLTGLKYLDRMRSLLSPLASVGCERDRAGNRWLHFDDYCMLVLLYLFNPVVTSLRGIQQASELTAVQKRLSCPRTSLGSLSEATDVFDPERLKEIIEELAEQLRPIGRDERLAEVKHTLTLVDGTLLKVLPSMAQASLLKKQKGSGLIKWRLHTHFEVDRSVPTRIDITEGSGRGASDEREVLRKALRSDCCYVIDRGYAKFELFNEIVALGGSYVCRIRDNSHCEPREERPLSEEDRQAEITADRIVQLGNRSSTNSARVDHSVRVIEIAVSPHPKRGKTGGGQAGPASDGALRLATNLMDVPAHIIALIYRYRWTIEIFFRFFKHVLGCRHLISHDETGIRIQTYCAIIACLLISLWTGRKPSLRTYEMICYYLCGLATEEELPAHLAKLPKHEPAEKNA